MVDTSRRGLGRLATVAAGAVALAGATTARGDAAPPVAPSGASNANEQIDAGDLSVGYADAGPPDGTPVILLHDQELAVGAECH